jgi:hypothetical protein
MIHTGGVLPRFCKKIPTIFATIQPRGDFRVFSCPLADLTKGAGKPLPPSRGIKALSLPLGSLEAKADCWRIH